MKNPFFLIIGQWMLVLFTVGLVLTLAGSIADGRQPEEIWEAKYRAVKIKAWVSYDQGHLWGRIEARGPLGRKMVFNADGNLNPDGSFAGVVYVENRFGEEGTYHVTGMYGADWMKGSHYTGHRFTGQKTSANEVVLQLTHKNGRQYTLNAHRVQ